MLKLKPRRTRIAPGCGPDEVKFEVKTEENPHPVGLPDAGKALVYFVQDESEFNTVFKPTTRYGVDGGWVGATHGSSFFYLSVDPGEHHLCASWQAGVVFGHGHKVAVAHLTAEVGGVYYFRSKSEVVHGGGTANIDLEPLDSDQGQLLASKYSFSTFHQKK